MMIQSDFLGKMKSAIGSKSRGDLFQQGNLIPAKRVKIDLEEVIHSMDSFRFTPPYVEIVMKNFPYLHYETCPFTPVNKELKDCKVALVTTGGLYIEGEQKPYDMEREKQDPGWGDPSYRIIPRNAPREKIKIAHRHYNKSGARKDINVLFPLDRFGELESNGEIGSLSENHYSFQGNIPNTHDIILRFGVEVAIRLRIEKVDLVFMTPA